MKFLFDLFPVLVFFGAYFGSGGDLFFATKVAMGASTIQVAFAWWRWRKVESMLLFSYALIMVLGGATLFFHKSAFMLWKPTALYWAFALVLAGAKLLKGRDLLRSVMGAQLLLPDQIWTRLTYAWIAFFVGMGFLNLYVAFSFTEATWVKFKLFGTLGLTLVFVIGQGLMLARYMQDEPVTESAGEEK
ncbi:putative intracellular septation protein A [Chitiniphilus shinanonensis]|uniref:Inner membrane-spanning protein YciB n=1 Tax=Chitiniphilus shinanonensis TaxID=553088 RepID=A0ABQ6BPL2_9NEIS|nr:septation protein A [Chitiniphilus shinanonensis]GLS03226.1 putative intracellular septation protein A [Chitiniphilus shinanonensis]